MTNENVTIRHAGNALELVINGAMRQIENETGTDHEAMLGLQKLLAQIIRSTNQWAENIDADVTADQVSVAINAVRRPSNLVAAIESLFAELRDLVGPDDQLFDRIAAQLPMRQPRPLREVLGNTEVVGNPPAEVRKLIASYKFEGDYGECTNNVYQVGTAGHDFEVCVTDAKGTSVHHFPDRAEAIGFAVMCAA